MENPEKIKKFQAKLKLEEEAKLKSLKDFLSTDYGQMWMKSLLEHCGFNRSLAASDPHKMAMCVGRHDVYLWLEEEINKVDPQLLVTIKQKEVNYG